MKEVSSVEKKILAFLEGDLPLKERPFHELSKELLITEEEIIKIVKRLIEAGIIRRIGAVVRHRKVGYSSNAMVVWKLNESVSSRIDSVIKEFPQISHAYFRKTYPGKWDYNFYTMIHTKNDEELKGIIETLAQEIGSEYRILRTIKEFKKSSPVYIRRESKDE